MTKRSRFITQKPTGAPSQTDPVDGWVLILKQLENVSDEAAVLQWKRNPPYYQAFFEACGSFSAGSHVTQQYRVSTFTQSGAKDVEQFFRMRVWFA